MTAGELIKILEQVSKEAEVRVATSDEVKDIEDVRTLSYLVNIVTTD